MNSRGFGAPGRLSYLIRPIRCRQPRCALPCCLCKRLGLWILPSQLFRSDAGRKPLRVDEGRQRLTERVRGDLIEFEPVADPTPLLGDSGRIPPVPGQGREYRVTNFPPALTCRRSSIERAKSGSGNMHSPDLVLRIRLEASPGPLARWPTRGLDWRRQDRNLIGQKVGPGIEQARGSPCAARILTATTMAWAAATDRTFHGGMQLHGAGRGAHGAVQTSSA